MHEFNEIQEDDQKSSCFQDSERNISLSFFIPSVAEVLKKLAFFEKLFSR